MQFTAFCVVRNSRWWTGSFRITVIVDPPPPCKPISHTHFWFSSLHGPAQLMGLVTYCSLEASCLAVEQGENQSLLLKRDYQWHIHKHFYKTREVIAGTIQRKRRTRLRSHL